MAPPDPNIGMQAATWRQQYDQQDLNNQHANEKFNIWKKLFGDTIGSGGLSGSGNFNYQAPNIPAPQYVSGGPVWNQSQINNEANLQRNNLMAQANNQSRMFTQGLASRGFSPLSPFAGMNAQNNMMRANAGAAANETNLNFNSAQANSDAKLKAAGINAGMYGDYTRNLLGSAQSQNQFNLQRQGLSNDFIGMLMRGLG